MKKRKYTFSKQKSIPLDTLDIKLPENIENYLSKENTTLLKCIMANYTIQDMAKYTGFSRNRIIYNLLDLGRYLFAYEILENKLFPLHNFNSVNYLHGWKDCKNTIRRLINDSI